MHVTSNFRSNSASQSPSSHSQQQSTQQTTFSSPSSSSATPQLQQPASKATPASPGPRSNLTVLVSPTQQSLSRSQAEEELSGNQLPPATSASPSTHQHQSSPLSSLASSSNPNLLNNNNKASGQLGSSSAGSSNAGSSTQTRNRRVFNFTTSAFGILRFRRLALNNPRLLRKYGITSVQIRDTCNGEASQRFDLPKRCPPSPITVGQDNNPHRPHKSKPTPKATQFVPISQNLLRSSQQPSSSTARSNSKLIAGTSVQPPQKTNSSGSLSMEQRTAIVPPQPQLNRLSGPQQSAQQMQETGGSSATESPLLMNLLSSNNNNSGQMSAGNGMTGQPVPQQQMNPAMMRYPNQQQLQSPMYAPGAQQSPQYMQQGRMPLSNMQAHPMMMPQSMGTAMPGQIPQQQMPPQQVMPPPVAQAPEQPVAKKRKRLTKKQKEEESKKQAQAQQAQTPTQMHPNMMSHQPQQMPQQMHPEFYMMQQQAGQQQRVPPVNMHMAPSQMQQYRTVSYPGYGQQPPQYVHPSASMMGTPPQYPGQQHYAQQMWNPNMPQHHMAQQSADYHMQMQRGQIPPQQQSGQTPGTPVHHYPQAQPSPVADMKNRIPPPSYNDSMQQQFVQQQRQTPSFMSPPANQPHSNQGPGSNYSMQQPPNQQMAMHQSAAHQYAQLHHRVMSDISDNVDEIMATIGGGNEAEDFDLDSIELEPMRTDGGEIPGMQQPQSVPTPQQSQQHPGPSPHYYQPQSIPSAYGNMVSYGSPSSQQFPNQQQAQQNYQIHSNMMGHPQQQMPHQQMQAQPPQTPTQPTREQQVANQKSMEKSREQQQKLEQKQLELAMLRDPNNPHTPSNIEVPLQQQQRVVDAIDGVMEKILSGKSLEDSGASTSSQPTPPPNKRKKASTAKNAQPAAQARAQTQAQQVPVQAMPPQAPQQQPGGQFNQMPMGVYGNGQYPPGTPTQFANSQQQQQYFYHQQRLQQQMQMRQMNYPGPSTPLSAPPVSTPDQQYFYGQAQQQIGGMPPQGIQENGPNGTPQTPSSRSNSFKNMMPRETSNPHTPQTPNQPTPQQISQKMFGQENGGGSSATSSTANTPSSLSQHRMSIDEQSQSGNPQQFIKEEQFGGGQQVYNQQQQYAQFNGHANQHFIFNQQQQVENVGTANEIKMQVSGAVSLKSQMGGELVNNPSTELCTPPSANAGISSATPTTASQINHLDTEPTLQIPKNEPPSDVPSAHLNLKHELKNSCENLKEELLSPNQDVEENAFSNEIPPKNDLNGPTSTPSTSTVAE